MEQVWAESEAKLLIGIGIGSTGPVDPIKGIINNPFTLPTWENVPVIDRTQNAFNVPVTLENDADVAALGEYWRGAGQSIKRLYAVTVGTGIGTALIVDGQIYRGLDGSHPEGGHMILDPSELNLIAAQTGTSGHNTAARERSAYHIAEAIMPYVKPDIPFYSILYYEQTLPFYIKRTFTLVQYQDEMDFGIKQEPKKWVPTLADFAERWTNDKEALAIVETRHYPKVQQFKLPMKEIFHDQQYVVVIKP